MTCEANGGVITTGPSTGVRSSYRGVRTYAFGHPNPAFWSADLFVGHPALFLATNETYKSLGASKVKFDEGVLRHNLMKLG
jgi:hypothetical protein